MVRNILIIISLFFTIGCGEKKIEPTPVVKDKNSTRTEAVNSVISTDANVEFVPAHIANSTIESVPH